MTGDPFTFQVWWRKADGRSYGTVRGYRELATAQKALSQLHVDMEGWPQSTVAAGTSRIGCPAAGPFPRRGEAGFRPYTVRAPELEDVA